MYNTLLFNLNFWLYKIQFAYQTIPLVSLNICIQKVALCCKLVWHTYYFAHEFESNNYTQNHLNM